MACVVRLTPLEAVQRLLYVARVTASTSIVKPEVETVLSTDAGVDWVPFLLLGLRELCQLAYLQY